MNGVLNQLIVICAMVPAACGDPPPPLVSQQIFMPLSSATKLAVIVAFEEVCATCDDIMHSPPFLT